MERVSEGVGFTVKDTGGRREFTTGSRRDLATGKVRPDLVGVFSRMRLGAHLALGCIKYGAHNWTRGQPSSTYWESAMRHVLLAELGLEDEDHLAAILFNIGGIIHNQEMARLGLLPEGLDDWPVKWGLHMLEGDPNYQSPPNPDPEMLKKASEAGQKYLEELRRLIKTQLEKDIAATRAAV